MNVIFGVVAVVAVAGGALFYWRGRKEEEDGGDGSAATMPAAPTRDWVHPDEPISAAIPEPAARTPSVVGKAEPVSEALTELELPAEPPVESLAEDIPEPAPIVAPTPEALATPAETIDAETIGNERRSARAIGAPIPPPILKAPADVAPAPTPPPASDEAPPQAPIERAPEFPREEELAARQKLLDAVASIETFVSGRSIDRDSLDALQALGNLSLDLDATVRAAAVGALGGIPSADAIPYLERALRDRDLDVVRAASEAISRYKFYPVAGEAEETLLPLNAAAIAENMAAIDALATLDALVSARTNPQPAAAVAAISIDPESQERLETIAALQAVTDNRPVNAETLQAVELLGELSLDLDATVRRAAVAAIGRIPSTEAIPYLERALRDSDSDVVGAASEAIARYKFYPPAIEFEPTLPLNAAPDGD